ncbi:uncharacterized protein LOC117893102 [Drosophila subobscura]|uniref:uncharacterized protein LOC117893102 n=1 Tax=Drosophila subobscura TaxID=7241 RepID=UPI00155A3DA1|nr:uncharacterized protein LOC117893102 [Drosophila subobscura]
MDKILEEVKGNVQKKFNEVRAALHMREKLLLRQLEVIANTQQQQQQLKSSPVDSVTDKEQGGVRFITGDGEEEEKLLAAIRSFGHFLLDNSNMQLALQDYRNTGLRSEDYIEPLDDHETMYKCLQDRKISYYELEDEVQPEAIVVDFSGSKAIVEDNAKRSIINITLQEAKELICKTKIKRDHHAPVPVPLLNLEELDDELESSIADAVSSLGRETAKSKSSCLELPPTDPPTKPKGRKQRFKPKITINNCNGTINLRNIASLTINCATEEAVSAEIPVVKSADSSSTNEQSQSQSQSTPSTTASSSNYSSNASSRTQSKKQSKKHASQAATVEPSVQLAASGSGQSTPTPRNGYRFQEVDTHDVTCDFYNRLLNEIKRSMKEKPRRPYHNVPEPEVEAPTTTSSVQTAAADSSCDANSKTVQPPKQEDVSMSTTINTQSQSRATESISVSGSQVAPGRRLVLKNFENLKIILEANSGDEDSFHPVQIEQWLAEIISETDLEPMQNTDILEHSHINNTVSP